MVCRLYFSIFAIINSAEMKRREAILISSGLLIVVAIFYQTLIPYHLFIREQSILFLFSMDYIMSYFSAPAPLTSLIGDYITQMMYLRYAGAIIIALIGFVEFWIWRCIWRGKLRNIWALIPTCADIFMLVKLSYPLAMSIGSICAVGLFLLIDKYHNRYRNNYIFHTITILISIIGTWAIGSSIIITAVLLLFSNITCEHGGKIITAKNITTTALFAITYCLTTLLLRKIYLLPLNTIWTAPVRGEDLTFIIMVIIISLLMSAWVKKYWIACSVVILTSLATIFTRANFAADAIYGLGTEYYFGNHRRVDELLKRLEDKKLNIVSYYGNLESIRKGTISDDLMLRYQPFDKGLFMIPNEKMSWLNMLSGYEAFALAKCHNMAQHAAMLANIFSPEGRSVRAIKLLARDNMIINDTLAADKYLSILRRTLFNSKIAFNETDYNDETLYANMAFSSTDISGMLLHIARTRKDNTTTLNYLLSYHLLTKNIEAFGEVLNEFPSIYRGRYYQEAQLIYIAQKNEEFNQLSFDKRILDDFLDYTKLYNEGNTKELERKYAKSYWFYYHFATLNK